MQTLLELPSEGFHLQNVWLGGAEVRNVRHQGPGDVLKSHIESPAGRTLEWKELTTSHGRSMILPGIRGSLCIVALHSLLGIVVHSV